MTFLSVLFGHIKNQAQKINFGFLLTLIVLQALGLLSLYSATYGVGGETLFLFKRQLVWILLSWLVFFGVCYSQTSFFSKILWPLFWLNLLALILVFFIGKEIYNAKRWLDLGLFHYQPSETLKLCISLLIAKELSQRPFGKILSFKDLMSLSFFILPPVVLVFIQPDLGTAGIILLISATLILFNGIEKRTFFALLFVFLISTPVAWQFILKPYQKERISNFIQPGKDPQGAGYNVIQSKIAIGSGQLLGKGFKQGTQNKLQFLPERHTDFIFSVLSEEYGFVGSFFTLLLFFFISYFIFKTAGQTRDRLSCYFCIGAGAFFLWHSTLNLAMTMGLFPVVGIPLPLLSYGGSHSLTTMAFLGLVACVHRTKDLF